LAQGREADTEGEGQEEGGQAIMWAFNQFPAKISFSEDRPDAPIYEVEVFGILNLPPTVSMVIFREISLWTFTITGEITMLPVDEFEKKFERFNLVDE